MTILSIRDRSKQCIQSCHPHWRGRGMWMHQTRWNRHASSFRCNSDTILDQQHKTYDYCHKTRRTKRSKSPISTVWGVKFSHHAVLEVIAIMTHIHFLRKLQCSAIYICNLKSHEGCCQITGRGEKRCDLRLINASYASLLGNM